MDSNTKARPSRPPRSLSKQIYTWIRDLHLYFGLFTGPFLIIFAVSTMIMNHRAEPDVQVTAVRTQKVELEPGLENREQAKRLMKALNLTGDLGGARSLPEQDLFAFGVARPGENFQVRVTLSTQMAEIQQRSRGIVGAMMFMHTQPGRHRPRSMVEWTVAQVWNFLTDTLVYIILFLTVTGIYLWATLKAERKLGAWMLVAGGATFLFVLAGFLLG